MTKKLILALVFMIAICNQSEAQLYKISLEERVSNADLIVEGKVQQSKSIKDSKGDIYTINTVEIAALLKGKLNSTTIDVITWGGETDTEIQTWSHFLSLKKDDYGIFTLHHNRELSEFDKDNTFSIYSDSQGFIKFQDDENGYTSAIDPFSNYADIEKECYQKIEKITKQKISFLNSNADRSVRSTIQYNFRDITIEGNKIKFDVYVSSLIGQRQLYSSGVVMSYNTDTYGNSLIANQKIVFKNAGISALSNYQITSKDLSENQLKVEVKSTGNPENLVTLDNNEQLLLSGELTIESITGNHDVSFDIEVMRTMNSYYANQAVNSFNIILVKGNFRIPLPLAPKISSITPLLVAAGTNDVITITGTGFGATQGNSYVEFSNAFENSGWLKPLLSDYLANSWTDTEIKVRVPSVGLGGNFEQYAGTGKIRLKVGGSTATSTDVLTVKYAVDNRIDNQNLNRIKTRLIGDYGEYTGYTLYYDTDFKGLAGAVPAFERALCNWINSSNVNFRIKEYNLISSWLQPTACKISLTNTLPAGTSSTTKAKTSKDYSGLCTNSVGQLAIVSLKKFDILFRKSANWYVQQSLPFNPPTNYWEQNQDLESFALHELGHAQLLLHSNNTDVMYWEITNPRRNLKPYDVEGGNYIKDLSIVQQPECPNSITPMQVLSTCGLMNTTNINNSIKASIYPNPTSDYLNIESDDLIEKVEVYDTVGQKLNSWDSINQTKFDINLENFSSGLYNVIIKTYVGLKSIKFQKI